MDEEESVVEGDLLGGVVVRPERGEELAALGDALGRPEDVLGGRGGDEEGADDGDAAGHHPPRLLRVLEHPLHVEGVEGGGCMG